MTVAVGRQKLTATKFLEWSKGQTERFELEDGHVIAMAAETAKHALMKHAATKALAAGIADAGLDGAVFPDGMTVVVDDNHVRSPDAAVQCAAFDPDSVILDQPVILVEVMSPSSASRDENHKLVEYFSIPSVVHYLLLSPDQRLVVHFKRAAEPGRIDTRILSEGSIDITPPGFSVAVADLLGRMPANAA